MASVNWITNAGTGDWSVGSNWSPGTPVAGDDATIGVSGTVTVTVTSAEAADSLTLNDAHATLAVSSGLTIGTTLAINAGTVSLNPGGTIVGGTIVGGGVNFNLGTLSGVSYVGTLDLSHSFARVTISNGITLSPTGGGGPDSVMVSGANSELDFLGGQTLSNAAVSLASTGSLQVFGAGATLTLDPSTSISASGRNTLYAHSGASIINQGSIIVGKTFNGAGNYLAIHGYFTNQGTISVANTEQLRATSAAFDNAAGSVLAIGTNSSALLGRPGYSFSNQGTITLDTGATLHLGGGFLQSDLSGIINSGGTVFLDGTLSNSGTVLSGASTGGLGTVVLDGTVVGGTLAGGGVLFRGGTLANASYVGTLDLSSRGSRLTIANGITLSPSTGTGPDTAIVTNYSGYLDFIGSQTLSNLGISLGSGQFDYGFGLASLRAIGVGTNLTLGQSVTISPDGAALLSAMAGDVIDNIGTISVAAANSSLTIAGSFANDGIITASNKDRLSVASMSGNGSVNLSGGATASFTGAVGSGESVAFLDHSGRLNVSQPGSFAASVQGFLDGNTIDLLGIGAAASYTYDSVNHLLVLKNAGGTQVAQLSLSLSPSLTNPQFVLGKDSGTGTLLTVQNANSSGTLTGTYTGGLVLSNPGLQNPTTLAASAFVANNTTSHSGDAVYGTSAAAWSLVNYGTIAAKGATANGIELKAGGAVTNQAGAKITAVSRGILISGTAGTVANAGYIGASSGIDLQAGGVVANQAGGTVAATVYGIRAEGSAIVTNSGYIGGNLANEGVLLKAGGTLTNQTTGTIIAGGEASVYGANTSIVVINYGTLKGLYFGRGIEFFDGGSVFNKQGGTIVTTHVDAIEAHGAPGYVNNAGLLDAGTQGAGVEFFSGGTVVNQTGGTIKGAIGIADLPLGGTVTVSNGGSISGSAEAIYVSAGATVTNSGVISGGTIGVDLLAGGTVIDSGTIAGVGGTAISFGGAGANRLVLDPGYVLSGIVVGSTTSGATNTLELASAGSVGTLSKPIQNEFLNFGTIEVDSGAQWVLPGYERFGSGVTLNNAGTLTVSKFLVFDPSTMINSGSVSGSIRLAGASYLDNSGTIRAIGSAVYGYGGANTVVNAGTISGSAGIGIFLHAGGTLVNSTATALIVGYDAGIKIGGAGTINNSGTIVATHLGPNPMGDAVYLLSGGTVSNSGTIGANHYGVLITGAAGTLDNLGTIAGTGGFGVAVYLEGGGYVHNATTGVIAGSTAGVSIRTVLVDGTVVNQGTIRADRSGVDLGGGGYVDNAATGLIASSYTGVIESGSGTVANSGTIQSIGTFGDGVDLLFGGGVSNAATGLIVGTRYGVLIIHDAGTITNSGTVAATSSLGVDGIYFITGGSIGNASTGLITGPQTGVLVTGSAGAVVNNGMISGGTAGIGLLAGGTVIDSGTIAGGGGTAILFGGSATNLLVLEPGYMLSGIVDGASGATNTLELASSGSPGVVNSALQTEFRNFATINVDTGAQWTLAGASSLAGVTLTDFGTLTNDGSLDAKNGELIVDLGSLFNAGTIAGIVTLTGGSYLDNIGRIVSTNVGVYGTLGAPTVINSGTIFAADGTAVALADGGSVFNTGLLSGTFGVQVRGGAGAVTNLGTIALYSGGAISLAAGGHISNTGLIEGLGSVFIFGGVGTITNAGTMLGTAAFEEGGTLINSGTIRGTPTIGKYGVYFGQGGVLTNQAGGTITAGPLGVALGGTTNSAGTIGNYGNIVGSVGISIYSTDIGSNTIGNFGTISGTDGTAISLGKVGNDLIVMGSLSSLQGVVSNLYQGDAFDLPFMPFSGGGTTTVVGNGTVSQTLEIVQNSASFSIALDPNQSFASETFLLTPDTGGGTLVTLAPVCLCRGTLILTDGGEVAVEDLAVGQRVVTLSGKLKPIAWIGFGRELVTRRNSLARPVIVRAGALFDNVPTRDLYLTHGHALYLDGVLIPVENLVNHRSIVWDEGARVVEYYHIELEDHDVVFANRAPAESYYNASNRAQFHNTRPGSAPGEAKPTFAPVLNGGEIVELVWETLLARAGGRPEGDTTDDPDLHLMANNIRLDPPAVDGTTYRFTLPAPPAGPLALRSRSGVPSLLGITAHDHRRIGVAISRIELRQSGIVTAFGCDAALFVDGGCHPAEDRYSWTDGELALPAHLFAHLTGAFTLAVHTERPGMRYPIEPMMAMAA